MDRGFYKLKCGCVKYTNRHTLHVRKGFEVLGTWNVLLCKEHEAKGLSYYEESLRREYLESIED